MVTRTCCHKSHGLYAYGESVYMNVHKVSNDVEFDAAVVRQYVHVRGGWADGIGDL
jgi:hypothetical protein